MHKEAKYIAEIGWNFMGNLDLADEMINKASKSGATHVKFQFWREENLKNGPWDEDGRREIYISAQLDEDKISKINTIAENYNIPSFFSVFNIDEAKKLNHLKQKIIKIPSHEIANLDLIKYCIENFSEILISAGACTKLELDNVSKIVNQSNNKITVMHCVSTYPCPTENINLNRLKYIRELFPKAQLGLSDHTDSTIIPAVAVSLDAFVIEKHFTTNHNLPGRDNKFALLPDQFNEMVNNHIEAMKSMIDHGIDFQECERDTVENYRGRWSHKK